MLAWQVYAFSNPGAKHEDLVVHWMTSVFGLHWLDQLVRDGKATSLGGNGYPDRYEILAGILVPILQKGFPANRSPLVIGDDYLLPEGWTAKVVWQQEPASLPPNDVLFLEVWDQS